MFLEYKPLRTPRAAVFGSLLALAIIAADPAFGQYRLDCSWGNSTNLHLVSSKQTLEHGRISALCLGATSFYECALNPPPIAKSTGNRDLARTRLTSHGVAAR